MNDLFESEGTGSGLAITSFDRSVLAHIAQYSKVLSVDYLKKVSDSNLKGDALTVAYAILKSVAGEFELGESIPSGAIDDPRVVSYSKRLLEWAEK